MRSLKEKYALSDEGVRTIRIGTLWTVLANLCIMAGMGILFALVSRLLAHFVDGSPLPQAWPYAVGLVVFFAAMLVTHWFQYTYTYGVVYRESGKQRIALAERLRTLPLSFFGRRDLADLTETIMTDATAMEHVYSHVLPELYGALISTGLIALGMAFFDWRLMLAAFWTVPVAFAILFLTRGALAPMQRGVRERAVAVSEGVQEALDCVREIRATNQQASYLAGLGAKIDEHERATTKVELANGIIVNSAMVMLRLGIATTVLVGAGLVASGQIDFLVMFGYLLVISRIYAPFDQCLMMIAELFASRTSAARMNAFYAEKAAEGAPTFAPTGHDVTFEHVAFSYNGAPAGGTRGASEPPAATGSAARPMVLRDVSFVAREGQVTALVGPSGSGKSTCARLAARFWDATGGRVLVGGVDVAGVDPEALLADFSVVFQDVLLFDDTVMGNIRLGRRDATDEEVLAAAHAANCDEFVSRLPQGYDTPIGENGSRLSGGERQRLSIARALLKGAPIVLLDEATASLDVENETQVQQALSRLLAGKTVIVIAHRMCTVMGADKVVVLRDGVVAEQGAPAELLAAGGAFAKMVELQATSSAWTL